MHALEEKDTMFLDNLQEKIEIMKKRKELINQHPYKVWQGKDGNWYTHFPDEEKGRILKKRKLLKNLEDDIIQYYSDLEENKPITFKSAYLKWRVTQDKLVKSNTVQKYVTDYQRFFEGTEFETLLITDITEETVKVFLCQTIENKKLCTTAAKSLFGYMKNTFKSALINDKRLSCNPMASLEAKQFYKYCTQLQRPMDKTIVTDKEMNALYQQFEKDYQNQPEYIPTYAVEFATLTGFRVSEISALKWECIKEAYIIVDKSEKYDRKTETYFIGETKNKKARIYPITDEIRTLLNRVKKVEMQYGYISEWVFSNEDGRIHAPIISSCSKNKCRQIGITEKGIHAYRRTVNSKLRCNGVSSLMAAALMGHSKEVNENYYSFDITTMDEKFEMVAKINHQTQHCG